MAWRLFGFLKEITTMKMMTTTNQRVQFYLTHSDGKASKHAKIKRMQQIEHDLEQHNLFIDELFSRKKIRVLDEIVYLCTVCGVCKIGADKLAANAGTSIRTANSTIQIFKAYKTIGIFVGYLKESHKYVFIDLRHPDAKELLANLFSLSDTQIAVLFAECFAVCPSSKKPGITSVTSDILSPNSKTNNTKDINNLKTSTKNRKPSTGHADKQNLYQRLKALYEARKGCLKDFKEYIGVIYGKMKKIKSDVNMGLTHAQLENILYQSFQALLNMTNIKNPFAMLNAIMNNKINDLINAVVPTTKQSKELIPDWFATRNENVSVDTKIDNIDFDAEREQILAKLGIVE